MADAGDKIGDDIKKPIQEKIDALKQLKEGDDKDAITKASEELSKEMQKIGEVMSKQSGEAERPGGGESAPQDGNPAQQADSADANPADKAPVEGEYEEVKNK
jgi:molecular chaperone DnaK